MIRKMVALIMLLAPLTVLPSQSQDTAVFKGLTSFKDVVSGVDFFAGNRRLVTPFEKPIAEAHQRLVSLLGPDLPKGAVFICSSLQQRDSVWEPRALKLGYKWLLISLTAEARTEETLARMKSQMGGEIPPEVLERIKSRTSDPQSAVTASTTRSMARDMALATLQASFAPERSFRVSRVDDVGRTPLPDWLDVGIASYAAGGAENIAFLQQRIEEAFPLEDVLGMSRPFVAQSAGGGGGGGMTRIGGSPAEGMPPGAALPAAGGVVQGGGGMRGGGGTRSLPKDQQDRMLFDGQASTFFNYLVEKLGLEKIKALIQFSSEGQESREWIIKPDVLGPEFDKIEGEWMAWIKMQKPASPEEIRVQSSPDRPNNPPK